MLTKVLTGSLSGVEGYPVTVETDMHRGMPGFNIVGLADTMIRESSQRIRPAIMNSGYDFPSERVTVNLVPASRPKEGSHFDLAIALGIILLGTNPQHCLDTAYFGEVSLDGTINPVRGILPLVISLRKSGISNIVLPGENAAEASIIEDVNILPIKSLREAADYMCGNIELKPFEKIVKAPAIGENKDFDQVYGQESVKRAIVIGTAGNHGMLIMGGPGCGKTMMASRIPGILPELSYEEKLEITGIYSVAGLLGNDNPVIEKRPFRSPHHTITVTGLVGGGVKPMPGEISLAHRGVLFLDEIGEFDMRVIDAMRQPVEEGIIRIRRNSEEMIFPAGAMIVAAANPCKCGNLWDDRKVCTCTQQQINAYRRKLMGPFADRIDMHIRVNPVDTKDISGDYQLKKGASTRQMREDVSRARRIQNERYRNDAFNYNSELSESGIKKYCTLSSESRDMISVAYEKYGMSMRAYNKVLKLSRTIADIDDSSEIRSEHVAEALMYRNGIDI